MNTAIQDFHIVARDAGELNKPVEISALILVELSDEIKALESEIASLRTALEYYANDMNADEQGYHEGADVARRALRDTP